MVKGYLDQTQKNQCSSQAPAEPSPMDTDDSFPSNPPELNDRSHFCYAAIMELTGQIYTDQTGRFITPSSNGNNYLLVLYDYDSNAIFAQLLITRTGKAILAAYKILHTELCHAGLHPKLQCLDNECSKILKDFMTNGNIDFQLIPPGVHAEMQPSTQSTHSKIISLQAYAVWTKTSPSTFGITFYRRLY